MSSFLSPLPPTTPDISVFLPDSGRCELAVRQRFAGRTDSGVAALDQESPGSIPGGATRSFASALPRAHLSLMTCCGAAACAGHFDAKRVTEDLRSYRANGPAATTRALVDALLRAGVQQSTLLDIGGGVGAIQHALLAAGAREATAVEASDAYLNAARGEAEQRGLQGRIRYQLGDFVEVAAQIPAADVVTLDRVVCCYPGMEALVRLSATRSKRLYGIVYPRGEWWTRVVIRLQNIGRRLIGNAFRSFVHSPEAMDSLIRSLGFTLQSKNRTFVWEVVVYVRRS